MSELFDCRDAFAGAVEELAERDERVVVVINDSLGSSKMGNFAKRFPNRLINVGIAEQDMVGVAAGLANGGLIPFVCGAASFLTARALDQVKVDLAYSRANVKLCGMSPGMAYGQLGATHHSIEDVAWLRALPNMTIVIPADPTETAQATRALAELEGPAFMRVGRVGVPAVHTNGYEFALGRAALLRQGGDVTLIANGTMVTRALAAAGLLAESAVAARVLNMACVRPMDQEAVLAAAAETGGIVTVEEHTIYGGMGSAVAELLATKCPTPMRILGVPGVFAPTGSPEWLYDHFGLSPAGIRDATLGLLEARLVR